MNKVIENEVYDKNLIDMYSSVIARRQLGFIDKEEVFITNSLSVIVSHAIHLPNIFSDEQYNNIIYILNKLTNG